MRARWGRTFAVLAVAGSLGPSAAWAGHPQYRDQLGEISVMGSYSRSNLGNNSYTTTRRYVASAGYNLTSITEIELSYSYTDTFLNNDPVQTNFINEQALGLSVIQALLPAHTSIQPYLKGGVAQYNRQQSGTISGIPTTPTSSKSPSALAGAGARFLLVRGFSLRVEGVTYLPDFKPSQAKDNFMVQGGLSWAF